MTKKKCKIPNVKRRKLAYGGEAEPDKFDKTFQTIEDVVSIIPIVGAGRAVGEGLSSLGGNKGGFGSFFGGMMDPLTPSLQGIKQGLKGDFSWDTFWKINMPGIGKMLSDRKARKREEAAKNAYKPLDVTMGRTVGIENVTPNVMSFANGGMMTPGQGYTEIEGPTHEEGGVQFLPDAEVEGGENIENGIVNSDALVITEDLADMYGLPAKAINKTVAAYRKSVEKKYKGREGDPFAMKTKELETNNISKMSLDISEAMKQKQVNVEQFHTGGSLPPHKHPHQENSPNRNAVRPLYDWDPSLAGLLPKNNLKYYKGKIPAAYRRSKAEQELFRPVEQWLGMPEKQYETPVQVVQLPNQQYVQLPNVNVVGKKSTKAKQPQVQSQAKGKVSNVVPLPADYKKMIAEQTKALAYDPDGMVGSPTKISTSNLKIPQVSKTNMGLRPTTTKLPTASVKGTGKISGAFNKIGGVETIMDAVPLIAQGIQAIKAKRNKPDVVKLPRLHADKVNVKMVDPDYQLQQVDDTFDTANAAMNQISKRDYLRRRIQSATEESKAKSGVLGQAQAMNVSALNRAEEINTDNAMRTGAMNSEIAMQEENINAANKGTYESNRDYQVNNLITMFGEYTRDKKLDAAQERYWDRYFKAMDNYFPGQAYDEQNMRWINTQPLGMVSPTPDTRYVNQVSTKPIVPIIGNKASYDPAELEDPGYFSFGSHGQFRMPRISFTKPFNGVR